MNALQEKAIADGRLTVEFARAQRLFDDCRIEFTIAALRGENQALPMGDIVQAAALNLGAMYAALLYKSGVENAQFIGENFQRAITDAMNAYAREDDGAVHDSDSSTTITTPIKGEEGGHG